jgi:hypothetical protein
MLKSALATVDDDYLYRNEDLVIRELIQLGGGEYVKIQGLKHLHQSITKNSQNEPNLKVAVTRVRDVQWETKVAEMQFRGIVKYTSPTNERGISYLVNHVNESLMELEILGNLDFQATMRWIEETNGEWVKYIKKPSRMSWFLKKLGI